MVRRLMRQVLERSPTLIAPLRAARDEYRWRTGKVVDTPHGFRLAGNAMMENGIFEPEEVEIIVGLMPRFDVFVDVGANIGFYTCLALKHGKRAVAFEPLASNVRVLCRNLEANGWTAEVWPIGLGKEPGIALLYGADTGASLVPGWAAIPETWNTAIPVNTLDNVLGHRLENLRPFIKIDVEGGELDVIRGAGSLFARNAIWLVEVTLNWHRPVPNPDFMTTFETFWQKGYSSFTADRERRPVTQADVWRWVDTGVQDFGLVNWLFVMD